MQLALGGKNWKQDCCIYYGNPEPVSAECRPKIFQSIETSCLQASFHWCWPSLCVSALTAARVRSSHPWVCTQSHGHNISQEAFMSTQGRTQQTGWDLRYRRPKVRGQYSLMFFFKAVFQDYLQGGFVFFYFGTNINLDSEMNWCGINLMPPDTDYLKNKEDFITCSKMNWFIAQSREYAYIFIKPHQLSFSLNLSSNVKSK